MIIQSVQVLSLGWYVFFNCLHDSLALILFGAVSLLLFDKIKADKFYIVLQ